MKKIYCQHCGKELIPARAFFDGEPTYVGVHPHVCEDNFIYETDPSEDDFECCNDCDLPDACADFGCAIKNGIK